MTEEDRSLKDYILIKNTYILKGFLFTVIIGILLLPALIITVIIPLYEKYFGDKTLFVNSDALPVFSGSSRVYDLNGSLLYEGDIVNGSFTGRGALYDSSGKQVYSGGFSDNDFSGLGELYYSNGNLRYFGNFLDNLFEGYGELFSETGEDVYKGEFTRGIYNGMGVLRLDDTYTYEGEFIEGNRTGSGTLYKNGIILYSGEFIKDVYNGFGKLYDNGRILYEGAFTDGVYWGQGTLYSKQGRLRYVGAFTNGLKNGFGKLYANNGILLYDGLFINDYIDYISLLGKKYDDIINIFRSRERRSYFSEIEEVAVENEMDETEVLVNEQLDAEASEEEKEVTEVIKYFCSIFEFIDAAIITSAKDNEPDYTEVICVWDNTPISTRNIPTSVGYEDIPDWLFPVTEFKNLTEKQLFRRLYTEEENNIQISFWSQTEESDVLFYTIEYFGVDVEKK